MTLEVRVLAAEFAFVMGVSFRYPAGRLTCLVIIQGLPVRSVGVPTFLQCRIVQTACFGQLHPQQLRLGCRGIQPKRRT
jgi:hypothetical protein